MTIQITVYRQIELLKGAYNQHEESIVTSDGRIFKNDGDNSVYISEILGLDEYHPKFVGYDAVLMERITTAPYQGCVTTSDMHLTTMLTRVLLSCNKSHSSQTPSYAKLLWNEQRPIIITPDVLEPILQDLIADLAVTPFNEDNKFLQSIVFLFRFAIDEGYFLYIS